MRIRSVEKYKTSWLSIRKCINRRGKDLRRKPNRDGKETLRTSAEELESESEDEICQQPPTTSNGQVNETTGLSPPTDGFSSGMIEHATQFDINQNVKFEILYLYFQIEELNVFII